MPVFNESGDIAAGVGGLKVSVNGNVIAEPAGSRTWVTNDEVAYQICDGENCRVEGYNIRTGEKRLIHNIRANQVVGGGGKVACWNRGGAFGDVPSANVYPLAMDANGNLAYIPDAQTGTGLVYKDQLLTPAVPENVTFPRTGGISFTINRPPIPGQPMVYVGNRTDWLRQLGNWRLYQDEKSRLILHPSDTTVGYVVGPPGAYFAPDLRAEGDVIHIVWSISEGEIPEHRREARINVNDARVELKGTPVVIKPDPDVEPDKEPTVEVEKLALTERQLVIVQTLAEQHPDWANGDDNERRKLAKVIAEQLCFEFGPEWGWKSNHGNTEKDAPSKDAIAKRRGPYTPGRQLLFIFDLFNGGTRKPNRPCVSGPEDEANQFFIPVEPKNHLEVKDDDGKDDDKDDDKDGDTDGDTDNQLHLEDLIPFIVKALEDSEAFKTLPDILAQLNRGFAATAKLPIYGNVTFDIKPKK